MNTPFLPAALRHSTIGPLRAPAPLRAGRWTDFAARLRASVSADGAPVSALQHSLASGTYCSDPVAIAARMLATLMLRRH